MEKQNFKKVTVRINSEQYARLRSILALRVQTVNGWVQEYVDEYIKKYEKNTNTKPDNKTKRNEAKKTATAGS